MSGKKEVFMYIDSFSYSNCGKYPENEDSLLCGGNVFAVADGLGGHGNGAAASACVTDYIAQNYGDFFEKSPAELLNGANAAVYSLRNDSRSTVAAAFVAGDRFGYTNVGDSRVYFFRDGRLICRTKDHSVCQAAVDAGMITDEQIRRSEDRSKLLKALGDEAKLKPPKEYDTIELRGGDAFLICSDGFWEYVWEAEMEIDLLKAESAEKWAGYMLRRHLKRSECECDNFSIVCGIVHAEGARGSEAPPKKKKGKAALIAASSLIAAAGMLIGAGVMYLLKDGGTEDAVVGASDYSDNSVLLLQGAEE